MMLTTSYSQNEIEEIFARLHAANPNPKIELNYTNSFTLLVAVVLAAQSTDISVNKVTKTLFSIASTPQEMLSVGHDRICEIIKTIGLFKNKTKNIIALSAKLLQQFDGKVPKNKAELLSLPGVGEKTANVILNECFGSPTIAVDTHVFRLANRLELAPGITPKAVGTTLEKIIPTGLRRNAHHLLVLHGRYVCKARKPNCTQCVINDICKAKINASRGQTSKT